MPSLSAMEQQKQNGLLLVQDSLSSSSLDQSDGDGDGDGDEQVSSSSSYYDLYSHLSIKRGISKFYNGKSQSFASLGDAEKSGGDLGKKGRCYNRRMKWSKSFVGINHHLNFGPKPLITKRLSPGRSSSSSFSPSSDGIAAFSTPLAFHA